MMGRLAKRKTPDTEYGAQPLPMEEIGIIEKDGKQKVYERLFKNRQPRLFEDGYNMKAYQVAPDSLSFSGTLDEIADNGAYEWELENSDLIEGYAPRRINGDNNYHYDAGNNVRIDVVRDGKIYSKNIDIFDVAGIGDLIPWYKKVAKDVNETGYPYIVTSPWYFNYLKNK